MALLGRDDPNVLFMTATMPANSIYTFFLWKVVLNYFLYGRWRKSIPIASCMDSLDLHQGKTQWLSLRAPACHVYPPPQPWYYHRLSQCLSQEAWTVQVCKCHLWTVNLNGSCSCMSAALGPLFAARSNECSKSLSSEEVFEETATSWLRPWSPWLRSPPISIFVTAFQSRKSYGGQAPRDHGRSSHIEFC